MSVSVYWPLSVPCVCLCVWCAVITHSAKETGQQNKLGVGVGGAREVGKGGLNPSANYVKRLWKFPIPPIIKPTPPPSPFLAFPPFLVTPICNLKNVYLKKKSKKTALCNLLYYKDKVILQLMLICITQ